MKKVALLVLLMFFCLVSGCGANNPVDEIGMVDLEIVDIVESRHEETDDYRHSFDTYVLQCDNLEFHVAKNLYEADQDQAEAFFQVIGNDYLVLDGIFDLQTVIKVYVVSRRDFAVGGFNSGENVYYMAEDITDADYRPHLTSAYIQTGEPWKIYGTTMYVFADSVEDNRDFLSTYYEDEENLMTLSLFAAYFNDGFADTETIDAAQRTARDFSRYLIDEYGTEYFLNAGLTADGRQEWLNSMGIDQTYTMPYDLSWLEGATYPSISMYESPALSPAAFVIKTPNRLYQLNPMHLEDRTFAADVFDTPLVVLKEISENHAKMQEILSYLEEHAPLSYPQLLAKYQEQITYRTSPSYKRSYTHPDTNLIEWAVMDDFVHETIHVLTIHGVTDGGKWLEEGLAEYFAVYVSGSSEARQMRWFNAFSDGITDGLPDNEVEFIKLCIAYYESKGTALSSFESYDHGLLYEAMAVVALTNPALNSGIPTPVDATNVSSYQEACLFVRYLVDNYGPDTVLSIALAETYAFEDYFGISRDEAFADFLAEVLENNQ